MKLLFCSNWMGVVKLEKVQSRLSVLFCFVFSYISWLPGLDTTLILCKRIT